MDDLARLKARLDRVVYMNDRKVASANKQNNTGTPTASSDAGKFYTVREGDTAFTIAKDNNITMKQLMDWNDLDFDQIKPGQKLRVKE
ncbi:MAG: LysM peptidoglycan-binding domain-containing protein [Bacteroidetes bacterium]|nr:LysM peptidoglycan-binding domain-containing protein [Bacteroidota bacterium]